MAHDDDADPKGEVSLDLTHGQETAELLSAIVLSTLPWTGGLSVITGRYFSKRRNQRVEAFLNQLRNDLNRLQDRVNRAILDSDEYSDRFEEVLQLVATTPQAKKHELFRGILLNSASTPRDNHDVDYYLHLVDTLSELHLRILMFLAYPEQYLAESGKDPANLGGGFSQMFEYAIPEASVDTIRSAFAELYRLKLINTDETIFSTMTSASGLRLLGSRVSDLGRAFLSYCSTTKE